MSHLAILYSTHADLYIKQNEVNLPNRGGLNNTSVKSGLQIVLGIAGAGAVAMIAYGALKYVLSQGNPQETNKAKDTIVNALIGLVICISAVGIIEFITKVLGL